MHKTENVPLVVVNFSTEDIHLLKGEVMGFMQNQSLDISEIITETSTEPSTIIIENNDKEVLLNLNGEVNMEIQKRDLLLHPLI